MVQVTTETVQQEVTYGNISESDGVSVCEQCVWLDGTAAVRVPLPQRRPNPGHKRLAHQRHRGIQHVSQQVTQEGGTSIHIRLKRREKVFAHLELLHVLSQHNYKLQSIHRDFNSKYCSA